MTSGVALLIALLLQSAAADAAPPRARLELRGAADCISREDLATRVAARSPRIQFADDAAIYAHVVVASTRPGNVVAELVLATPGAEPAPRRFAARSCAEAADAIALIIAVTLDPTLKRNAAAAAAVPAPGSGAPPEKSGEDRAVTKPPPAPPAVVEARSPATPAAARRSFGVAVAGQAIFGPAPAVMPGMAVSGIAALDRDGLWAPALIVGLMHAWRDDLAETGGNASFTLDAAAVDACPLRLGRSWFVARGCAAALFGRLNASGANTQHGANESRPFGTAGAALVASVGRTVEVSARLGVGVTLLRDSYEFGGATFHRAGAITTTASLGIGLHWR